MNKNKNGPLLPLIFGFSLPLLLAGCPSAFNTSPKGAQVYVVRYFDTDGRWLKGADNNELSARVQAGTPVQLYNEDKILDADKKGGLAGWAVMIGGLGEVYAPGESLPITRKIDFYAVWVEGHGWKVTYGAGEGQGDPPVDNRGYSAGTALTVRDPGSLTPPADKVFVGWKNQGKFYPAGSAWLLSYSGLHGDINFEAVWAEEKTDENFKYAELDSALSSSGVVITGYTGTDREVVIPPTIDGKNIVSIGYGAFQGKGLTSVAFAENLLSIGSNAFRDNGLTEITLPKSLTHIGKYAFARNKLQGVIVDNSAALCSIGEYAFFDNVISSANIPQKVELIGDYAFYRNKLPRADLRSGGALTHIGAYAFYDNQLRGQLIIPSTVTTIGAYALAGNQPLVEGAAATGNLIPQLTFEAGSELETIGIGAFSYTQLGSDGGGVLTIPASVETIEREAFTGNVLWKVQFAASGSLETIGIEAFSNNLLTELALPEGLTSLGSSAFAYNRISGNRHGSAVLSFPGSLKGIGNSAFLDNQITEIELHNAITEIKAGAFYKNEIQTITIGAGVKLEDKAMGNYDDGRIKTFRDFYSPLKANGDGKEREAGIAGKYTYYRPGDPVLGWKKEE